MYLCKYKMGCLKSQAEIIPYEPDPGNAGGGRKSIIKPVALSRPLYFTLLTVL